MIFQNLLQIQKNQILLDIFLHLGTLLALIVFLFKDIKRLLNIKIVAYLSLTTALTAIIVILGEAFFESMFSATKRLSLPLLITGIILLCTKKFGQGRRSFSDLKIMDAVWLGITQGFCVIPGLSRSGITISTLLFRNVQKETAFKFSLLASILAVSGALIFKIGDFSQLGLFEFRYMSWGLLFSFFSGLLALKILLSSIRRARFYLFGYYCLTLALIILIFL